MIEVLKKMVEALEWCHGGEPIGTAEAIKVGKQAIAELESQEPVAVGEVVNERGEVDYISYVPPVGTALYTTPPAAQRQWVGLTDDELTDLFYNTNLGQQSAVAQAIALLKERNT